MLKIASITRGYCNIAAKEALIKTLNKTTKTKKIDFKTLHHTTKVPKQPIVVHSSVAQQKEIDIDSKTIQLLERLSLVDLDSEAALETLKSSIEFADKIVGIETSATTKPLFTVLENENLQLRDDQVTDGNCREEILQNAKITDEDYYVSPPGNIPLAQEEKSLDDIIQSRTKS